MNQQKGEKIFHDQSPRKNVADLSRGQIRDLVSSQTLIQLSHRGRPNHSSEKSTRLRVLSYPLGYGDPHHDQFYRLLNEWQTFVASVSIPL